VTHLPPDVCRSRAQLEGATWLWTLVRRRYPIGSPEWVRSQEYLQESCTELTQMAGDDAVERLLGEISDALKLAEIGPPRPMLCCYRGRETPAGRISVVREWKCPRRAVQPAYQYCSEHAS
jgi:hypothetical protein